MHLMTADMFFRLNGIHLQSVMMSIANLYDWGRGRPSAVTLYLWTQKQNPIKKGICVRPREPPSYI